MIVITNFIFHSVDGFTYLKTVFVHQNDGLEGGASFVGQPVERLLFPPALLLQGVTHHTGGVDEARAEVERDVGARFGAATTRQVHLKPARMTNTQDGSQH